MLPIEIIAEKIRMMRGQKVMLDRDLAKLYGVETKHLKRQVRRNSNRFPDEFMFVMTKEEFENWRYHFGASNVDDKMGLRYTPMVFTEHGIVMLSSIFEEDY